MPPKATPTHFLCLPLAGAQLTHSLASFRADVTSANSFAVPEQAVRPPGTLHLTLGVMNLQGGSEDTPGASTLGQASQLLRSLRTREALDRAKTLTAAATSDAARSLGLGGNGDGEGVLGQDGRLAVTLKGLRSMQPARKATVLYAPPADATGLLRRFCEQLREPFVEAGLMLDDGRPLLLHATMVNTIYVKGGSRGGGRGRRRERLTIDAENILDRYQDFVWIEGMPVRRLAICRMGAKAIEGTDDAAYEVEAEIEV
jgi:activating signal cointegrator complex subunit 1